MSDRPLVLAVPKGRILKQLAPLLGNMGVQDVLSDDRRLIRESDHGRLRILLLKPDDVPTYVEYGAADLGIVGRDVLLERRYDLYVPLDLGIGRCRLVVAGVDATPLDSQRVLRVATKFPNAANEHFRKLGKPIETIFVQGSVELAPLTGLADVIVDLVESGETLRQNGLRELQTIADVSSVAVANRAEMKLRSTEIRGVLGELAAVASL